jgi:hypothetical protein
LISLRKTPNALELFKAQKRCHVAIWDWIQRSNSCTEKLVIGAMIKGQIQSEDVQTELDKSKDNTIKEHSPLTGRQISV